MQYHSNANAALYVYVHGTGLFHICVMQSAWIGVEYFRTFINAVTRNAHAVQGV